MAEVEGGQIEEVDNKEKFARPEVATDPEHDEAERQKVVLHIVRSFLKSRTPRVHGL